MIFGKTEAPDKGILGIQCFPREFSNPLRDRRENLGRLLLRELVLRVTLLSPTVVVALAIREDFFLVVYFLFFLLPCFFLGRFLFPPIVNGYEKKVREKIK